MHHQLLKTSISPSSHYIPYSHSIIFPSSITNDGGLITPKNHHKVSISNISRSFSLWFSIKIGIDVIFPMIFRMMFPMISQISTHHGGLDFARLKGYGAHDAPQPAANGVCLTNGSCRTRRFLAKKTWEQPRFPWIFHGQNTRKRLMTSDASLIFDNFWVIGTRGNQGLQWICSDRRLEGEGSVANWDELSNVQNSQHHLVNRDHRSSLNILGSGTTYTLW